MRPKGRETMTAQEFWDRFQKEICGNPELCFLWNDATAFTARMLEKLEKVISEKDCKTEREYFRIDLISYRSRLQPQPSATVGEDCLIGGLKRYSWDLLTAVEHENDHRLWMDEVVKLAHVASPLRVVIGYIPLSMKEMHEAYLTKVAEALEGIEAWRCTKDYGEFLIIIGDCKLSRDDEDGRCVYTPYVFQDGRFTRLNCL